MPIQQPHLHLTLQSGFRSICAYVSRGYHYWTCGSIRAEKARNLARKFHANYGVLDDRYENRKRIRRNLSRARLVMLPGEGAFINWYLLVSAGKGEVWEREGLKDARCREHPLRYRDVVLRHRKAGEDQRGRWSWYLDNRYYQAMRDECLEAIKLRRLDRAPKLVGQLMVYPPYHGIRHQRQRLFDTMLRTAAHAGHPKNALEFIPKTQGWTRFKEPETAPLSNVREALNSVNDKPSSVAITPLEKVVQFIEQKRQ